MGLGHSPTLVTNGLVLCLDAGNTKSYPGSGTAWNDLSNTSNGTLANGAFFSSDNLGAINFDGTNDMVTVPNVSAFSIGTTCTHECVLHWNGNNQSATACGKWGGSPWAEYTIGIWGWDGTQRSGSGNNIVTTFYLNNPNPVVYLVYQMPAAGVYFVQATHNTSEYKMWVNGQLIESKTYSPQASGSFNTNASYGVGKVTGSTAYYTGRVHFCRLYNRVLTESEILQNYNSMRSRFGI